MELGVLGVRWVCSPAGLVGSYSLLGHAEFISLGGTSSLSPGVFGLENSGWIPPLFWGHLSRPSGSSDRALFPSWVRLVTMLAHGCWLEVGAMYESLKFSKLGLVNSKRKIQQWPVRGLSWRWSEMVGIKHSSQWLTWCVSAHFMLASVIVILVPILARSSYSPWAHRSTELAVNMFFQSHWSWPP